MNVDNSLIANIKNYTLYQHQPMPGVCDDNVHVYCDETCGADSPSM